jgi:hypothetical protein
MRPVRSTTSFIASQTVQTMTGPPSTRTGLSITRSFPRDLGRAPTRSHHLVHELVECERAFAEVAPGGRWQDFYAERIIGRFGDGGDHLACCRTTR